MRFCSWHALNKAAVLFACRYMCANCTHTRITCHYVSGCRSSLAHMCAYVRVCGAVVGRIRTARAATRRHAAPCAPHVQPCAALRAAGRRSGASDAPSTDHGAPAGPSDARSSALHASRRAADGVPCAAPEPAERAERGRRGSLRAARGPEAPRQRGGRRRAWGPSTPDSHGDYTGTSQGLYADYWRTSLLPIKRKPLSDVGPQRSVLGTWVDSKTTAKPASRPMGAKPAAASGPWRSTGPSTTRPGSST